MTILLILSALLFLVVLCARELERRGEENFLELPPPSRVSIT
jgi:hypothetical protein